MSLRVRDGAGFTLVELLVVIGLIAMLIAMLLPSLGRAREQARAVVCASQLRQLTFAWMSYATDHAGNLPGAGTEAFPDWVVRLGGEGAAGGVEGMGALEAGSLWRYVRQAAVYRCPAEPREEYLWSYAMADPAGGRQGAGWRKLSQLRAAERQMVFLEDNDNRGAVLGSWIMVAPLPTADSSQPPVEPRFIDMLAGWHRLGAKGGTNIAYADGHVAARMWEDRRTTAFAVQESNLPQAAQPDNRDLQFLAGVYHPPR